MNALKVIMTRGLPASGKSTWAREEYERGRYKLVSKDELRAMLDNGKWSKANEHFVCRIRDGIISEALIAKFNVIVHDTNFEPIHEKTIREIAFQFGGEVEIRDFSIDLDEAIARDLKRMNSVGEKVIRNMYDKYIAVPPIAPEHVEGAPEAIIADLDGTLALFEHHRGPYDASTCEKDELCPVTGSIVRQHLDNGGRILLMSGRQEKDRGPTERWLAKHGITYEGLFMRATGDQRKDWIVKKELYEANVKGRYNVLYAIDDRDQVVSMWRSLGLVCLQVRPGAF